MSDTEIQVKGTKTSEKQTKNGDEQIEGMSVTDGDRTPSELTDPAILVVCNSKIRYTLSELKGIRETPLSQKKPVFLDIALVPTQILDPEKWNLERKKSDTPTENGQKPGEPVGPTGRRLGDARERIKKENDGIVLSPQRRSFNTGCFVAASTAKPAEPPAAHIVVREIPTASRRIGSGRILRDWDAGDKPGGGESQDSFGGFRRQNSTSSGGGGGNGPDEKFGDRESRSGGGRGGGFGSGGGGGGGFDNGRDKDKDGPPSRRNGRYGRRAEREIEEPEWFSSGPTSQNDTIELRGFDDPKRNAGKLKRDSKRAKEWAKKKGFSGLGAQEEKENEGGGQAADAAGGRPPSAPRDGAEGGNHPQGGAKSDHSLLFEDFFKTEDINNLLTNGVGSGIGEDTQTKSRFASFFKKDSPEKERNSGRSSLHDEHNLVKDMLKDMVEGGGNGNSAARHPHQQAAPPGDSDSYFAPISPAGNTGKKLANHFGGNAAGAAANKGLSIMEMLQRGNQQEENNKNQMSGKILKLDEIEAKMRQNVNDVGPTLSHKQHQMKQEEDMTAFKRLLAQVTGGHAVPASNGPMPKSAGMSLMEMLQHSQQQDEAARRGGPSMGPVSPGLGPMHAQNDIALKLQQAQHKQQMDSMFGKLLGNAVQMRAGGPPTSPLHDLGVQQSRELLNRPEAQAILHGLNCGDLTPQHLYQQLGNPGLQPRHKELLSTILKHGGGGGGLGNPPMGGPSPRVLSPVPPPSQHHIFQQQIQQHQQQLQQQLRVSPLPPNAYCVSPIMATSPNTLSVPAMHQRIPSPRELQIHTQNILQKALIKKKLEEQTENYRKKQEQQRGTSPNTNGQQPPLQQTKSVSSPTPLAFTPTSVLRKMTADKDDGKENRGGGDGPKPLGRALTAARQLQPQQQQLQQLQQQWAAQQQQQGFASVKQPGRPIVKANSNPPQQQPSQQFSQSVTEQFFNKHRLFNQQQQQQQPTAQQQRALLAAQQQQQQQYSGSHFGGSQNNINNNNNLMQQQQQQQGLPSHHTSHSPYPTANPSNSFSAHQLRAQHQQRAPPSAATSTASSGNVAGAAQAQSQAQQMQGGYQGQQTWQQFLNNAQHSSRNNPMSVGGNGGDLSPTTSDQLARWFSPDLLERARGGELPSTAQLASQQVLSLEEIEQRQTAPPAVRN
ncbi:unnamed protein product [Brassicogethes aeneus]|uniref:Eukaryotic translation initiation factor 4E transporter n=1 Tax=Brassicogethes aeneus TaxID=1431903 RepID=A0A9P0ARC7_BRAAE|nr:unnamed protein product [Brassicogethes aeneus]